jgi:DNA-binding CsgD family transcriptional regulator
MDSFVCRKVMVQEPTAPAEDTGHMKPSLMQKDGQRVCEFLQQSQDANWHCRLLEFSGQPCAKVTLRGHIEWATTSAHRLLQRYWPADTGVGNRLPCQIRQWMTICRKRLCVKDKLLTEFTPLAINRPSACLTIRYMYDGAFSALLFEERLFELQGDRLACFGLTRREAEVVQWLVQGKSSCEIATILNISVRTVSKHLERIYLQLRVENRHAAVALMHDKLIRTNPRR